VTRFDKVAVGVTVTLLAATGVVVGAVAAGVLDPKREEHCRIEVYSDGSAEPICQPGWMPTRPIDEWPIIRVYG
jgi:hypothetical protein